MAKNYILKCCDYKIHQPIKIVIITLLILRAMIILIDFLKNFLNLHFYYLYSAFFYYLFYFFNLFLFLLLLISKDSNLIIINLLLSFHLHCVLKSLKNSYNLNLCRRKELRFIIFFINQIETFISLMFLFFFF